MAVEKYLILIILSLIISACASNPYGKEVYSSEGPKSLGVRYLLGRGVPKNDEKALYYFSKAANEGDVFAQNEVAYLYAAGKGTPRDYGKALLYYRKAAEQDLASAQYSLGLMYARGLGTPVNMGLAIKWFRRSADHGFEPAQIALSRYS